LNDNDRNSKGEQTNWWGVGDQTGGGCDKSTDSQGGEEVNTDGSTQRATNSPDAPMAAPVHNLKNVMNVSGQNVVVTGGSSGIGYGISQAFAQRGANVAILDIDLKSGEAAVETLPQFGTKHVFTECDIADRDAVRKAVDAVCAIFGHIDVLVNNAGTTALKPFLDMDCDLPEWHQVINVNLHGTVNMTHAVANKMRADKRGGLIINISSIGGASSSGCKEMPMVGYVASKAAINHITRCLAVEFAEYNIRVNCIMPGPTHSGLDNQLTLPMRKRVARTVLTRRYGEPLEIGALCVFFASPEGAHLDGVVVPHDGGFLCAN
jgi:NAD(P)-dependent dehydrogenase (short-subunit alcohol dehydrogenase family)